MTVLLTVQGFEGTTVMSEFLRGELNPGSTLPAPLADFAAVTESQQVKYAWYLMAMTQAVNNLNDALNAVPADKQIIVLGHSNGQTAQDLWIKNKAPASAVDPARLAFVAIGNDDFERDVDVLASCRYRVIVATRCYDVADKPNVTTSPYYRQAVDNWKAANLHVAGYKDISLNSPGWVSQRGSITFQLHRTEPAITGVTWEQIESAYNRPLFGALV